MFWHENKSAEAEYRVPDDVVDLIFRLRGENLDIDHAYALAEALRAHLSPETCNRIGVHGIRLAGSGNGWNRPEQPDAELPLSRRARLIIRVHRDQVDEVRGLSTRRLQIGRQPVEVGDSTERKLSTLGTLHARAIRCEPEQSEQDFMLEIAAQVRALGIEVNKMICGRQGYIRTGDDSLFTRSLMIADLKPEESVRLQQQGIGNSHIIGCGLFVPHKGIDAVHNQQESN